MEEKCQEGSLKRQKKSAIRDLPESLLAGACWAGSVIAAHILLVWPYSMPAFGRCPCGVEGLASVPHVKALGARVLGVLRAEVPKLKNRLR